MKKNKLNILVIALAVVVLFVYIFFVDGIDNIINVIRTSNPGWMFCAVSCILIYWLLESGILHIMTKRFYKQQKFFNSVKTSMMGQFFNCTTPFASGGQPMQAYHMTTYGVPLGTATCSLIAKFIVYQLVLTAYSLVVLIFKYRYFASNVNGFTFLVIIGFVINSIVALFLLAVAYFRKPTQKFFEALIKLLYKIKLVKNYEERMQWLDRELSMFYDNFRIIKNYKATLLKMAGLTVIQLTVFFLIPYFIYLSFGGSSLSSLPYIISAQAFVLMISSFVPLPGAMGAAELSFSIFLGSFFQNKVGTATIFWRLITFYLPLLVGSVFSLQIRKEDKQNLACQKKAV